MYISFGGAVSKASQKRGIYISHFIIITEPLREASWLNGRVSAPDTEGPWFKSQRDQLMPMLCVSMPPTLYSEAKHSVPRIGH